MDKVVFVLCALMSLVCAALLLRGWLASRSRLLLYSALCFVGLMLNNVLLVLDKVILPATDLSVVTKVPALVGLALFVFGLIWEGES